MNTPAVTLTPTRAQFLEKLTEALKRNAPKLADEAAMARFLAAVKVTLEGGFTVTIDSVSFKEAWKACGLKGKVTYKGLHALTP